MNIIVNEQAQAFWLAYPDRWVNAVGHEIKVGEYQFCATPKGKKINVSEITTGTKLFEYQIDPLTWLVAATKEGYINYLHVVGERIAEIMSGSKNFDREFERMKKASFEMLGAMPPIENVDLG
ncbi:hypothetical protein [Sporosarcina sp. FSL K6-1508]|uniref:hypothetical protein n=1 Tax=Sporosarcina sp. FSL K6-1508 TaxID=2921553 RepID=UPI0030F7A38A